MAHRFYALIHNRPLHTATGERHWQAQQLGLVGAADLPAAQHALATLNQREPAFEILIDGQPTSTAAYVLQPVTLLDDWALGLDQHWQITRMVQVDGIEIVATRQEESFLAPRCYTTRMYDQRSPQDIPTHFTCTQVVEHQDLELARLLTRTGRPVQLSGVPIRLELAALMAYRTSAPVKLGDVRVWVQPDGTVMVTTQAYTTAATRVQVQDDHLVRTGFPRVSLGGTVGQVQYVLLHPEPDLEAHSSRDVVLAEATCSERGGSSRLIFRDAGVRVWECDLTAQHLTREVLG